MNKLAPSLGGDKSKAFVDAGNAPMLAGAWYATLELNELIALLDERQQGLFIDDCAKRMAQNGYEATENERRSAYSICAPTSWAAGAAAGVEGNAISAELAAAVAAASAANRDGARGVAWAEERAWQKERAIWYLSGEEDKL